MFEGERAARRRLYLSAAIATALGVPVGTSAQQQAEGNQQAASGSIEEIVVTSRRREESIQDIPMSVQAFTAEMIELANIETGRDYHMLVPNLVMAGGGGDGQIGGSLRIRGVPGVGVYLDGIWQGNAGVLLASMLDVERIETLRGPQGTLFGRNTNGGAIQYITARPDAEFGADASITAGNLNRMDFSGSVNIPLTETLFTRWTAGSFQRDGYLKLVGPYAGHRPEGVGTRNDLLLRGDILWEPSDRFSARVTYFDGDQRSTDGRTTRISNPNNLHLRAFNALLTMPGLSFPAPQYDRENYQPGYGVVDKWETRGLVPRDSQYVRREDWTATLNWNITDRMSLISMTGYREQAIGGIRESGAADMLPLNLDANNSEMELFSQEIHLTGSVSETLNFLVGGYFSDTVTKNRTYEWVSMDLMQPARRADGLLIAEINQERLDYVRSIGAARGDMELANYQPDIGFNLANDRWNLDDVQDMAIFGEFSWAATDRLELTLGVRWSSRDVRDEEYRTGPQHAAWTFETPQFGGGWGSGPMYGGELFDVAVLPDLGWHFTPKLSGVYSIGDNSMVYATYAEGFSQADTYFNEDLDTWIELDPEVVENWEIGFKSDLLDGKLRLNAAYFRSDWTGMRVTRHPPDPDNPGQVLPNPYTVSSGVAEVEGFETEITYYPTDQFRLNFNGGWLDTAYVDIGDPELSSIAFGRPFAYAPEYSYSVGAQYDFDLPSGALITFRSDYGWMDEYERDASTRRQPLDGSEPAYGLLSARIRYTAPSEDWEVALHGSNLTNEYYVDSGFDSRGPSGFDLNTVGPSRTYGVTVSYRFQ